MVPREDEEGNTAVIQHHFDTHVECTTGHGCVEDPRPFSSKYCGFKDLNSLLRDGPQAVYILAPVGNNGQVVMRSFKKLGAGDYTGLFGDTNTARSCLRVSKRLGTATLYNWQTGSAAQKHYYCGLEGSAGKTKGGFTANR